MVVASTPILDCGETNSEEIRTGDEIRVSPLEFRAGDEIRVIRAGEENRAVRAGDETRANELLPYGPPGGPSTRNPSEDLPHLVPTEVLTIQVNGQSDMGRSLLITGFTVTITPLPAVDSEVRGYSAGRQVSCAHGAKREEDELGVTAALRSIYIEDPAPRLRGGRMPDMKERTTGVGEVTCPSSKPASQVAEEDK